jgi:hypothetical protein
MRNKFKVILHDGSKYKPPKGSMLVLNQDGVVFLVTDYGYAGYSVRLLSEVLPKYFVIFTKGK